MSLILVVCLIIGSAGYVLASNYSNSREYKALYDSAYQRFDREYELEYFSDYTKFLDADWLPVESEGIVSSKLVLN